MLARAGFAFEVGPFPDVEEVLPEGLSPPRAAQALAEEKVRAVLDRVGGRTVLAADTVVVLDGQALGKPRDAADARRMLARLSGRRHAVVTGVAVGRGSTVLGDAAVAEVTFRPLMEDEIAAYVATGEPLDKAGAYGIQGGAAAFVRERTGSLDTVIGLPLDLVRALLARLAPSPSAPGR